MSKQKEEFAKRQDKDALKAVAMLDEMIPMVETRIAQTAERIRVADARKAQEQRTAWMKKLLDGTGLAQLGQSNEAAVGSNTVGSNTAQQELGVGLGQETHQTDAAAQPSLTGSVQATFGPSIGQSIGQGVRGLGAGWRAIQSGLQSSVTPTSVTPTSVHPASVSPDQKNSDSSGSDLGTPDLSSDAGDYVGDDAARAKPIGPLSMVQ